VDLAREVSEYKRDDETLLFSLIGPQEWGTRLPHEFVGTYRLEPDQTWKKLT
jgi:hypothetical protein